MDYVPILELARMEADTPEDGIPRVQYHADYIEDVHGCAALRCASSSQIQVAPRDSAPAPTPLRSRPALTMYQYAPHLLSGFFRLLAQRVVV